MIAVKLKARIEKSLKNMSFPSEEDIQLQLIRIRSFYVEMRHFLDMS
jgi:hypothetical protein